MAAATTAILAATVVASTAMQYKAGKDAAEAAEEQQQISANQSKIQQDMNRRQQIREERVRRAAIAQSAQNTGVAGSSSASGSVGALSTITAGNLASSFQADRTTDALLSLSGDISAAQQEGQKWQAIGSLAGVGLSATGGIGGGSPAGKAPTGNMQGQQTPLFNNTAFVKNF